MEPRLHRMSDDPDESYVIDAVLRRQVSGRSPDQPLVPGDDCALLPSGEVVTVDAMVEGVHFDGGLSPADVGWKLVAVNASDVGAMGCRPTWALLTMALPRPLDRAWVDAFAEGLADALETWGIVLAGGDTTASPGPRLLSMTMAGQGEPKVGRHGARPGDELWVSGTLGAAAAGFLLGPDNPGRAWLRRPRPPVELGARLGGVATAMLDLSDGLATDLQRMCDASGVGAEVDPCLLPVAEGLAEVEDPLPYQVAFGEDYQLLFAAPPGAAGQLHHLAEATGTPLTRIGLVVPGRRASLVGRPWPLSLFTHFGASA